MYDGGVFSPALVGEVVRLAARLSPGSVMMFVTATMCADREWAAAQRKTKADVVTIQSLMRDAGFQTLGFVHGVHEGDDGTVEATQQAVLFARPRDITPAHYANLATAPQFD